MKQTTVYLEEETHDRLMKISDKRTTFSEHIRRAVDEYLEKMTEGEQPKTQ
jgi:predicted DNA-binding protein